MKKQKIFKFEFKEIINPLNFYVNETNLQAFNGVINNNYKNIYLYGPKKSGKSYLSEIWTKKYNAIKLDNNFERIIEIKKNVFIDDI